MNTSIAVADRLSEIASILAAGLLRLRGRQSSRISADRGESCVASVARPSGHAVVFELADADE